MLLNCKILEFTVYTIIKLLAFLCVLILNFMQLYFFRFFHSFNKSFFLNPNFVRTY